MANATLVPQQRSYAHTEEVVIECSDGFTKSGRTSASTCVDGSFEPVLDVTCALGKQVFSLIFLVYSPKLNFYSYIKPSAK